MTALATTTLPDGRPVAVSGGDDGTIRLWDLQTGTASDSFPAHEGGVKALVTATLPDGWPVAVSGGLDGTIRLWDVRTDRCIQTIDVGSEISVLASWPNNGLVIGTSSGWLSLVLLRPVDEG